MQIDTVVQLVSDLGALGFVLWLAHRLTAKTIPDLTERYTSAADKQRADFRQMLEQQRVDFSDLHKRDHDVHEARMATMVDAIRTLTNEQREH